MNNNPLVNTTGNYNPSLFEFKDEPLVNTSKIVPSVTSGQGTQQSTQGTQLSSKFVIDKMRPNEIQIDNYAYKALAGIQEVSTFSLLFFSNKNITEIQKLIRYNVYISTDKTRIISNQDETELLIVMRSMYLQYAKIPRCKVDYTVELKRLNDLTVTTILPDILSSVEQYLGYLKDSTTNLEPLSRGSNASIAGEKILRSVSDVLVGDNNFFGY